MPQHDTILVLDFGSQYTQLIARRVREQGVRSVVEPFGMTLAAIRELAPRGIVLSGGPQSVYGEGAPHADRGIFELGVPVLGICYGMQLAAFYLGGEVSPAAEREYGRATLRVGEGGPLFAGMAAEQQVWMSHGDRIAAAPPRFATVATSDNCPIAAFADPERRIYGIQFHPEVSHTENGTALLRNFLFDICGARADWTMASFRAEAVAKIRAQVGDARVVCGLSGGVDSAVTALLVREAIGEQLTCIFVDHGLLRKNEAAEVLAAFWERLDLPIVLADARERFFSALVGVSDPESKRKIMGREFIAVFEEEARKIPGAKFLAQGTLYPDVIESVSIKGPSAVIKTHHNVGGLPERMGLKLVEPVRELFKDEVRQLGRELGMPAEFVGRHPFPGPGLAVRILGEITRERASVLQEADAIAIEEIRKAGLYDSIAQALVVLLPVRTVGVMGDERTYGNVVALRCVETQDFMTADWSRLPYALLDVIARRIVNEVRDVNRVVYDITSKPPGTIEWE